MNTSKSNFKRTVNASWGVFLFPGHNSTWEIKSELSSKILIKHTKEEDHRNCATHICQTSWVPKTHPCTLCILTWWFTLYDQLAEKSLLEASQRFGVPWKIFSEGMAESIIEWVGEYCWNFFQRIFLLHKTKRRHVGNL